MTQEPTTKPRVFRRVGTGRELRCGVIHNHVAHPQSQPFVTPEYALVYLASGSGRYETQDGTVYPLRAGDMHQRFPDVPHIVHLDGCTVYTGYYVAVPPELYPVIQITCRLASPKQPVVHLGQHDRLIRRFEVLSQELRCQSARGMGSVIADMHKLMVDMLQMAQQLSPSDNDAEFVDRACVALETNLEERLSLADIAVKLGVSYPRFRKVFREQMGIPPGEYRIRERITYAKSILLESQLSVKEVSQHLGYPDVYTFSRQFKRFAGVAPGRFQRENQL